MSFADLDAVIARSMLAWKPPERLSLSEWADRHFILSAESAAEPGRWHTLPYQRGIMDAITDPAVTEVTLMKSARVGYALALDTPLPTPAGWTTMGGVSVGDALLDNAGRPCRVRAKSEIFRDHDCYRVRFCDGSEIIADAGHRWMVEADVSLEHLAAGRSGHTGRPKPGETATFSGVLDTATMARAAHTSRGRTALAIVNARALELPDADLPIPPYTLGLWLGDGHSVAPRITQHRPDVETAEYVAEEGAAVAVRYLDKRYPNNATILLGAPARRRGVWSEWSARLRDARVLHDKHIPSIYLRAAYAQRLALLRGLMDSDGTVSADGRAEFVNTNEELALGVYELVVSLGMKASLRGRPPQRANCLAQWRVNFKPTPSANPFRLRRKAARVKDAEKPTITLRRRVVSVERVTTVQVQCVEVDSPSHLYLAGRQMVPTHNTLMVCAGIGYYVEHEPASQLVVQPTVDDGKNFSKESIAPMFRDVPRLAAVSIRDLEDKGPKNSSNTLTHKAFPGGILSIVGANSGAGFRRISRRIVWFDEIDAYPPSAGSEGDQIRLGIMRTQAFWNRKIIAGSTPLTAGTSRIAERFDLGDQRRYYVPCPQCGHMDILTFREEGERGHFMRWPEKKPEEAFFVCRKNGCIIEHKDKRGMVERGEWRAEAPFRGHASFAIWAAYSYAPNATWGQLAAEFVEANKAGPEKLKTFVNTILGETWLEKGDAPDWQRLSDRREDYAIGTVPAPVILLTAGVDVQRDRLVWEVVGWGEDRQSWSVDAGVIAGDTSGEHVWTELDALLARTWQREGGSALPIHKLAIDSGYNTQQVYNWARRHPMSRVIATKGMATARTLVGAPSAVDLNIRGKRMARGYKVWPVGVDVAKAEFYGWLRLERPKTGGAFPPGFCHFPAHEDEFFKQLTAEHLVRVVRRTGFVHFEWQVIPGRENHWLDCRVYARAAAALSGLDRHAASMRARAPATPVAASVFTAPAVPPAMAETAPPPRSGGGGFLRPGRPRNPWLR